MAKEKTRKKKKRRKKNYLLRFVILILIGVSAYFVMSASFFEVTEVEVVNNNYFTKEQVLNIAGVENGENIFFDVNTGKVKDTLMEEPYIRNAKVKIKLPSTVVIEIEEREEKAAVKYGDSYIILDGDGLVLRQTDVVPSVTELTGLTLKSIQPGTALDVEENYQFSDTLDIIGIMDESEVYFKKIDISSVKVRAYIYDKLVCVGTPETIISNLNSGGLQKVLFELYSQGVERGTITVGADGSCAFSAATDDHGEE
ncbi:MAG: FtsQ-type POTRA domain-containing protein [Firmicutes bacterium]|nr:FtsQ-type POTRA domain-containing protein [Bacillota bacterium]